MPRQFCPNRGGTERNPRWICCPMHSGLGESSRANTRNLRDAHRQSPITASWWGVTVTGGRGRGPSALSPSFADTADRVLCAPFCWRVGAHRGHSALEPNWHRLDVPGANEPSFGASAYVLASPAGRLGYAIAPEACRPLTRALLRRKSRERVQRATTAASHTRSSPNVE